LLHSFPLYPAVTENKINNNMHRQLRPSTGVSHSEPCSARLRLMATTDLHMNLCSYDYHADSLGQTTGLTRTATLIRKARAEAEARGALCLLFDNGDGLQGTPMGDLAADTPDQNHPLADAFAVLGYDAIGLGNHDFNFGLDTVAVFLRQAPCPVISSNLVNLADSLPRNLLKQAILDRTIQCEDGTERAIRIGVLSVLPPQTVNWDADALAGKVEIDDIVTTARSRIGHLRDEGCDIVVALAHTGIGASERQPNMENALLPLSRLPGLDALVAGHTHLPFASAGAGPEVPAPTVLPGASGSHLGVIDLDLQYQNDKGWYVVRSDAALRPIAERNDEGQVTLVAAEDPELVRLLDPAHQATRARMREEIGTTAQPLHSFFSFFAPDRALAVVATAQEQALRKALQHPIANDLPLLSAVAPGKFGGRSGPNHYTDIAAGPIRMRNVADLNVFPNTLKAVVVSGSDLRDWLDMSACLFNRIEPGSQDQPLLNEHRAGHNFDVIHGITYQIDLSVPARFASDGSLINPDNSRIRNIRWNGQPVGSGQQFVVATNSYRVSGGGNFPIFERLKPVYLPELRISDVLRTYFTTPATQSVPAYSAPWRFKPMADTRITVETGPAAAKYLHELKELVVQEAGRSHQGFLRLSLDLAG